MKWVTLSFSKAISDVTGGNTKIQKKALSLRGKIPVVDQGHELIAGYTNDEAYFKGKIPIVLFGDHTRIFKYIDFPFALGADGVKALQTKDFLYPKFFFYFCQTVNIPSNGYSRHFKFLKPVHIPIPPPSEQRKIVEILDQADRLRKLRAEADKRLERILPALFIKMFGDPATNPMGWETGILDDVIIETQYGTSTKANTDGKGVSVIRMNNVDIVGNLDLSDIKYVELSEKEKKKHLLSKGDIIFNRTNSKELVGKTGIWPGYINAVMASYLIRVRTNPEKVVPEFIWASMNMPFMKQILLNKSRRAIGMANINAKELRSFPIFIPAKRVQQKFSAKLHHVNEIKSGRKISSEKLDKLFTLLLHRAFTGDLTASWRQAHMKELLQEIEIQARALAG